MRFSPVRIIGAAAVLLAALWLAYAYRQSADARRLADSFESTPGIVLTGVERHRGHFTVRGFRDPIAEPIATIVGRTNIAAERVTAALTPFVSLDPAIVEARARLVLQPPETITIRMAGEVLNISGSADPDWLSRARDRASLVPGLEASLFDVSIEAPGEPRQSEPDPGAELRALADSLDGATIRFGVNDAAIAGTDPIVRELAAGLDELDRRADKLGVGTELRIAGFSDATGTAEANARVRLLRAQRFAALLTSYAERKPDLVIEQPDPSAASAERKAVLSVMIRGDAMGD